MSIKVQFVTRTRVLLLGVALFSCAILYKIIDIQFIERTKWKEKAERTHIRVRPIKATRGNIFSNDGGLLATSLPFYTVSFDPSISTMTQKRKNIFDNGIDDLSQKLSDFFGDRSANSYKTKIIDARAANRKYVRLNKRQINYSQKKEMETWPVFKYGQLNGGVIFEKVEKRFNPFRGLARRTIGSTRQDTNGIHGQYGLEYSFDKDLAGVSGLRLFGKIGGGVWKPLSEDYIVDPEQGKDIETTIDVNIQDFAETALLNAVEKHKAKNGCVVVMEVATGEIKALVNIDESIRNKRDTSYREIYNHAVGKRSEPGSTMKLASVLALLEDRSDLNLSTEVETGNGKYKFFDREMRDSKYGGHGKITFKEGFKVSSNILIAKLVQETFYNSVAKQQKFIDYLKKFGLVEPLDFQLVGGAKPLVPTPEDNSWSGVSLPWMSTGYSVEMSPLQMLCLYNTVANDGYSVKPILTKRITHDGELIREFKTEVAKKRICSQETLDAVKEMLYSVVNEKGGTATTIASNNFSISGKTGTKQNLKNGRYIKEYYATFAGFFPSEKPKYSIIVAIDKPSNGKYYGSDVAAPVFKDIADKIYTNDLSLHDALPVSFKTEKGVFPVVQAGYYPDLKYLANELSLSYWGNAGEDWVRAKRDDELKQIKWKDLNITKDEVPNVKGMTIRDALSLLENMGLRVSFSGRGRIVSQSQEPGTKLLVGSSIKLELR